MRTFFLGWLAYVEPPTHDFWPDAANHRNRFVNCALIGKVWGTFYACGVSSRKSGRLFTTGARPLCACLTRRHLLVMAERFERQAEDLDKEFVDAAAPERPAEAGSSESDNPERRLRSRGALVVGISRSAPPEI